MATACPHPELLHITHTSAEALAAAILAAHRVPPSHAALITSALLLADLRGVDTHGLARLPGYIARIEHGVLNPAPPPLTFEMRTPIMALLDAHNASGFVAASLAIDKAVEIASVYGLACVAVRHSNHYGMAATYVLRAVRRGYGAMAFTNAAASMPPWGGRAALLGTSPLAVGVPGGREGDFVLDMSPAVVARGKIRRAARRGEPIPEGWGLDGEGRGTTDPGAVLDGGVVLPIAGPKGSGLAVMMDVFAGVMSGAAFAGSVRDQYRNLDEEQDVGHWFLVFKPEVFLDGGREELKARMDELVRKIRGCEKAAGFDRIYTSGEIETETEAKRRREGIPYSRGEVDALHTLARESGVDIRLEER